MSEHAHQESATQGGTSPKTFSAYLTGLVLCVLLTLIAFGLVAKHALAPTQLYSALAVLAIVQLIVQVVCFLRLNASAEGRWNVMPFFFTILVISILVGGSLWIMFNLNYYMMH